ncbi:MAG TPA: dihydrofolate reductase family protein [Chloroflexota bacterium]|nr:dihydrofolate reductase family protein [Chloroflexota bacterium]
MALRSGGESPRRYFDLTRPDDPPGSVAVEEIYRHLRLPRGVDAPVRRPYTTINMVSTVDGKVVVGGPGTTGLIGGPTDHRLMRRIMMATDGEVFGAQLIRDDNPPPPRLSPEARREREARGLRPVPMWAIVTTSAEFEPDTRALEAGRENLAVFATNKIKPQTARAIERRAHLYVSDAESVDFATMGTTLRERHGVDRLNCMGGPSLNWSLIAAGAADELFLTFAPKLHGGRGLATAVEGVGWQADDMPQLELLSLYGHGSELYLRYRLPHVIPTKQGDHDGEPEERRNN